MSASDRGFLLRKTPPKVPFKLTPTVRKFAAVIAIRLSGLPPCGDSDTRAKSQKSSLQPPLMVETNNESSAQSIPAAQPPIPADQLAVPEIENDLPHIKPSLSIHDIDSGISVDFGTSLPSVLSPPATSTTPQLGSCSSKRKFATTQQQRKRQRDSSTKYYDEKASLVSSECARRKELHTLEVQIKKEELAAKQQITAFWKVATEKLSANVISIADVASLTTINSPAPLQAPIKLETETVYLERTEVDDEVNTAEDVTFTYHPESVSLNDSTHNRSPFRQDQMYEKWAESDASETYSSDNDSEDTDPTFRLYENENQNK